MKLKSFLHPKVKLIQHDALTGLVALEKPIKVLSHPNGAFPQKSKNSIITLPYNIDKEKYVTENPDESFYLLNRLDQGTSGIILVSTSESTAKLVKKAFAERTNVVKRYYAISIVDQTFGYFPMNTDIVWQDNVKVLSTLSKVRMIPADSIEGTQATGRSSAIKTAITSTRLVSLHPYSLQNEVGSPSTFNLAFLELSPSTGFTHQLRFQCARHGFPLLGDSVYGDFQRNKLFSKLVAANVIGTDQVPVSLYQRLFLHSHSIELTLNMNSMSYKFLAQSSIPPEFTHLLHTKLR